MTGAEGCERHTCCRAPPVLRLGGLRSASLRRGAGAASDRPLNRSKTLIAGRTEGRLLRVRPAHWVDWCNLLHLDAPPRRSVLDPEKLRK